MRDLIPAPYPANTWRGFLVRVATIALAALLVLGAIDLFEYLHSTHPSPSRDQQTHPSTPLQPQDAP